MPLISCKLRAFRDRRFMVSFMSQADNLCYNRKDPKQMATSRVASSMEELQGESLFLYVMVVDRNAHTSTFGLFPSFLSGYFLVHCADCMS
ncbi:hypothetical protein Goarm_012552 [Gossypium armourianum]|uniref:Uncharacterized protein n=1 Tax=Gossypium armourianum TaxID=34283 RepID=A0A7J9J1U9_9ROSI|nr:hypothetical protein [Gossypium armourianum]